MDDCTLEIPRIDLIVLVLCFTFLQGINASHTCWLVQNADFGIFLLVMLVNFTEYSLTKRSYKNYNISSNKTRLW